MIQEGEQTGGAGGNNRWKRGIIISDTGRRMIRQVDKGQGIKIGHSLHCSNFNLKPLFLP